MTRTKWVVALGMGGFSALLGAAPAFAQSTAGPYGPTPGGPINVAPLPDVFPGALVLERHGRVARLYGVPFGFGNSPAETAGQFLALHADLFGVSARSLQPESYGPDGPAVLPLMYLPETETYKFTLLKYGQHVSGIPVFRADVRLLVRNEPRYPLVWVGSSLRPLGDFAVPAGVTTQEPGDLGHAAAGALVPGLVNFTPSQYVIWAGINDMAVEPVLAVQFFADNGPPAATGYEKWLFIANVATGEIAYREDFVVHVNVSGNVSGLATDGTGADICHPEVSMPLPYARVDIQGGNFAYANANGNFVIPHPGTDDVTVVSDVRGQWFRVFDQGGSNEVLSQVVTPPGPADFVHNAANTSEFFRAEVNAYIHANVVRDFALFHNPAYPTIGTQTEFPINVNIDDTCNAFHNGTSINFFRSGGGCTNTGNSTIVYHEYGHHLVQEGGNGQDQYGEGMSDSVALVIVDSPLIAIGLYSDCNGALRNADNGNQYPCDSGSQGKYYCGGVLSGSIWHTREELIVTEPVNYRNILGSLTINSIPMHGGDQVGPDITVDFLTLDDNDADLTNGTPHSQEICTGFGLHNMGCPAMAPIAVCVDGTVTAYAGDNCCALVSVADVDGGSYDPSAAGDVASICITAVDGNPVGCLDEALVCGVGQHSVTLTITDQGGLSASCDATVVVQDNQPPDISIEVNGGAVDANCEFTLTYSATVTDNCCIDIDDVSAHTSLIGGSANLGVQSAVIDQVSETEVHIDGSVPVSNVTECPAVIEVEVTAADCEENSNTDTESAEVNDATPPTITCNAVGGNVDEN
ncbi:MAG TPA: hypothetical protein PKK06_18315, partial [Phycisphaerae bacterium]|nr:hypothetical protein [Phycisphaerae bacterium]HNU47162.1 hypothetical protein [Phycisphaerae bacterium]